MRRISTGADSTISTVLRFRIARMIRCQVCAKQHFQELIEVLVCSGVGVCHRTKPLNIAGYFRFLVLFHACLHIFINHLLQPPIKTAVHRAFGGVFSYSDHPSQQIGMKSDHLANCTTTRIAGRCELQEGRKRPPALSCTIFDRQLEGQKWV